MSKKDAADAGLTFAWDDNHPRGWTLIFCMLLALLAHAGAIWFFDIRYPEPVRTRVLETPVLAIIPSLPNYQEMTEYLAGSNPALFSGAVSQEGPIPGIPPLRYNPAYLSVKARLQPLPDISTAMREAILLPPIEHPLPEPPSPPRDIPASRITVEGDLPQPASPLIQPLQASTPGPWRAAIFLIAAGEDGKIRFIFPEQLSGDSALDTAARSTVLAQEFPPAPGSGLRWARAIIHWGGNVAPPASP